MVLDSSTVITPSLPTFFMASAMMLPMVWSLLAEIVPTWAIMSPDTGLRSEDHTLNSSHLGTSYAVFCLNKKYRNSGAARRGVIGRQVQLLCDAVPARAPNTGPNQVRALASSGKSLFFFLMIRRPPRSTLFPCPALSR